MKITPNDIKLNLTPLSQESYKSFLDKTFTNIESTSIKIDDTILKIDSEVVDTHPFLLMLQFAFNNHKGIIIKPDDIWLLICQGLSNCIKENVVTIPSLSNLDQKNKETISVRRDDFIMGASNPWEEIFPEFAKQLNQKVGEEIGLNYILKFSTSTEKEITSFIISYMDSLSRYFNYSFLSLCGIPEIEILGDKNDYIQIKNAINYFKKYNLNWWLDEVENIIDEFINALQGEINTTFWNSIFKEENESGGPYITGWITKFFPIIREKISSSDEDEEDEKNKEKKIIRIVSIEDIKKMNIKIIDIISRNPIFEDNRYNNLKLDNFNNGINSVPFKWRNLDKEHKMNFISGFMGIQENEGTLSTQINWIIQKSTESKSWKEQIYDLLNF